MLEGNNNHTANYSIKVKKGNAEVEVSAPDKDFVLSESKRLIEEIRLYDATSSIAAVEVVQGEVTTLPEISQIKVEKPQTLGEFLKQFASLQTNLDRILVFGYWCEIKQDLQHFTAEDILAKYKEAREAPPANIRRDLGSLVSKGLLLPPDKSDDGLSYALSRSGIKEVESKMSQT